MQLINFNDSNTGGAANIKGDWMGLYKKFLKSDNFQFWLRHRTKEIQRTLNQLHLQVTYDNDHEDDHDDHINDDEDVDEDVDDDVDEGDYR